jgi:hypothetical protein
MLVLALVGFNGCGAATSLKPPRILGRSFNAEPLVVRQAPAPAGDPPSERDGTVPPSRVTAEIRPSPGAAATSPKEALRRYALTYTNWQAINLSAHERALAALAIGPARLAAEQTVASESITASLAKHNVTNRGVVLSITAGEGPARGQWVVVTQEQTTGTGPYVGLAPGPHVTFAKTKRSDRDWFVFEWSPQS